MTEDERLEAASRYMSLLDKPSGQTYLFEDDDFLLRNSRFKDLGDRRLNQEMLVYWWMYAYIPSGYGQETTPYEIYRTWSNAMWSNFKYVKTSGYCPETNQAAIDVCCYKHKTTAEHMAELNMWVPHIKPVTTKYYTEPYKHIGIFEHTLSEYASYSIAVLGDGTTVVDYMRYHRHGETGRYLDLTNAIDYVRLHLWYEDGEE